MFQEAHHRLHVTKNIMFHVLPNHFTTTMYTSISGLHPTQHITTIVELESADDEWRHIARHPLACCKMDVMACEPWLHGWSVSLLLLSRQHPQFINLKHHLTVK